MSMSKSDRPFASPFPWVCHCIPRRVAVRSQE